MPHLQVGDAFTEYLHRQRLTIIIQRQASLCKGDCRETTAKMHAGVHALERASIDDSTLPSRLAPTCLGQWVC